MTAKYCVSMQYYVTLNNTDVTHTLIMIPITQEDVHHWKTNH